MFCNICAILLKSTSEILVIPLLWVVAHQEEVMLHLLIFNLMMFEMSTLVFMRTFSGQILMILDLQYVSRLLDYHDQ